MNELVKDLSQNDVVTYAHAFLSGYTQIHDLPCVSRRLDVYVKPAIKSQRDQNAENCQISFVHLSQFSGWSDSD